MLIIRRVDEVWIDDYAELMFGENHNLHTMEQGADLKNQNMPCLLYKYRKINDFTLEALEGDFLFSSQPRDFNDPFEGPVGILQSEAIENIYQRTYTNMRKQYPFLQDKQTKSMHDLIDNIACSFGGSYDDVSTHCKDFGLMKLLCSHADKNAETTIAWMQEYARNMYNICCFSETYDNNLMWAHYADNHSGFCIGYNIKNLNNNLTHLTLPVIYKDNFFISIDDLENIDGSKCMHALSVKSPEWSYEKEWRTFFPPNPPSHKELMPTPKVVLLGSKISNLDRDKLKKICTNKGITLYQMKLQLGQHRLIAEAI